MTTPTRPAEWRGARGVADPQQAQRGSLDPRQRFGVAAPGAQRSPDLGEARAATSRESQTQPGRWQRLATWQRVLVLVLIGVLLAGGGFLVGWLTTKLSTVRALRLAHGVHAGASLGADDVEAIAVPAGAEGILPAERVDTVLGKTARTDLPAGALLRPDQLGGHEQLPKSGQALVGLALKPGQAPVGGLHVGDTVRVVSSAGQQADVQLVVLAAQADVWGVRAQGGTLSVTLLVDQEVATQLAAYAASQPVSLVRLGAGGS